MMDEKIYYLPFKTRLSNAASIYHLPFVVLLILAFPINTVTSVPIGYWGVFIFDTPILLFSFYQLFVPIPLLKITEDKIYYSPRLNVEGQSGFYSVYHTIFTLKLINVIAIKDLKAFDKNKGIFVFHYHKDLIPHLVEYERKKNNTHTVYAGGKTLEDVVELPLRFERFSNETCLELYNDLENHINDEKKYK